MKRWLRGPVVLATAVGLWSCSGDPTDSFRGGASSIVSTPSALFLSEGETQEVLVQALDDQGNALAVTFAVSGGAGVTVVEDTTFLPTNGSGPIEGTTRYLVTAGIPVGTSFIVSAEGLADTVPIRILPLVFTGAFSNATPALGDTVTLTAQPGLKFGDSTGITFPGAAGEPVITGISADSTVLSFLPAPGTDTTGFVSGVELIFAPGVPLDTLETSTKITTPAVTEIPAVFSNANPAVNEAVVVTAPGFIFLPGASVVLVGLDTVLVVVDTATVLAVAADGSSLSFIADPGATGIPNITGTALAILPSVSLSLPATTAVTIAGTVPPMSGTGAPGTAPTVAYPAAGTTTAFYDTAPFGSAVCGEANDGAPCQLYKIVVPADGALDATLKYPNTTDLGLYVLSEDGTTDTGQACDALGNGADGGLEACTLTLAAGTYLLAVVNFGPFYSPVDPAPDYLSLTLTPAAAE